MDLTRPARSQTVTVILPVFNGGPYVASAVRSIQRQTWPDWKLIIIDDASTDESLEVCRALAREDSRITVHTNRVNQGLARTMNRLVSLASTPYIAVQEQDDISVPERLELEVGILNARPDVGLVSGLAAWLDDNGEVFKHFPGRLHRGETYPEGRREMVRYLYTEQCKVVNAACMFRRSMVDGLGQPFDPNARMSIDWQFFVDVAHMMRIVGIPRPLVYMRRGAKHSSVTKDRSLQFKEARRCIRRLYRRYRAVRESPIDYGLYRNAMATQLYVEGRVLGGFVGLARLFGAVLYGPFQARSWRSIYEQVKGVRRRVVRRGRAEGR